MTDETMIRTADGREVALLDATWEDLGGQWEADGSEELKPPLPMVTVTHEMTRREGAAAFAGRWYHADRDAHTEWLECVLLLRRRTRALFAKGEDRPVCSSNDGDAPVPNAPLWLPSAPAKWQTTNGASIDMQGIWQAVPDGGPKECRLCPFTGHEDPETGQYSAGLCRASVLFLADRIDDEGGLCLVRLSATQARGLERFIKARIRARQRPLASMRLTIATKRTQTRDGNHVYELQVAGEDLPVAEALPYRDLIAAERERFGGDAMMPAPVGDPETGEVME